MSCDLETACDELHARARPGHWCVGRPVDLKPGRSGRAYASDTRERRRRGIGHRTQEWTATATTEARGERACLNAERWPPPPVDPAPVLPA